MLSTIPIFIVARGNNELKIKKNQQALKFSFVFIKDMGLLNQTYVISDNEIMLDFAKRLGFKHTVIHKCYNEKDLRYIEYNAIHNFHLQYETFPDWFILLSIDAIFANTTLIRECIKNIDDKYDVVTTFTEISDRTKFFIDENHQFETLGHKITNEKYRRKMADAEIYAIKSSFARECMQQKDPAEHFWNGNFKFFRNVSAYTDINDIDDINKYSYIGEIIDKVRKINI